MAASEGVAGNHASGRVSRALGYEPDGTSRGYPPRRSCPDDTLGTGPGPRGEDRRTDTGLAGETFTDRVTSPGYREISQDRRAAARTTAILVRAFEVSWQIRQTASYRVRLDFMPGTARIDYASPAV